MNVSQYQLSQIAALLGRRSDDRELNHVFGSLLDRLTRDAYYGTVVRKKIGIELVFKEAPWVLPPGQILDPKALHFAALHMHREGHQGHSQYPGKLPNEVEFGDTEEDVVKKMGHPVARGGGDGLIPVINVPIPRWLKFQFDGALLHCQLDNDSKLEMVTLMTPDISPKAK